jgi:uncharacterized protein (TIGR02996 family)
MSERDALLAAIVAQPDDDTARLVYADWLQEHGQERRAQFIRAQVWEARAGPYSPEARKQARLADSLIEGFRGEWSRHLQQRLVRWEFRRGFVEHAAVNVATFARDAADLFRLEPVRSLQPVRFASGLTTVPLEPFFEVPQLERVTRLDFTGFQLSPVELEPLELCRYLGNLTDLSLHAAPVLPPWLRVILIGPALPALAGLDLSDVTNLGPLLAEVFPNLVHRQFLRLDLGRIVFTSAQLRAVLESPCVREVEELRLAWMLGTAREGALSHLNPGWAIPWKRLRLLDLHGQGIGDDGVVEIVKALARRPGEAPLRWLGLAHNHLGSEAVRALLGAPESRLRLYHLDVRGNGLTLSQRHALQERFPEARIDA